MKKDLHPTEHQPVIFLDNTSGEKFLVSSTVVTEKKEKWTDGKEYPLFEVEVSSASHPFYTGKDTRIDTAGRADKFNKRKAAAKSAPKKTKAAKKTDDEVVIPSAEATEVKEEKTTTEA